ncbi:hypothetical protein RFI_16511, partial [Reticulomyxa filosa]
MERIYLRQNWTAPTQATTAATASRRDNSARSHNIYEILSLLQEETKSIAHEEVCELWEELCENHKENKKQKKTEDDSLYQQSMQHFLDYFSNEGKPENCEEVLSYWISETDYSITKDDVTSYLSSYIQSKQSKELSEALLSLTDRSNRITVVRVHFDMVLAQLVSMLGYRDDVLNPILSAMTSLGIAPNVSTFQSMFTQFENDSIFTHIQNLLHSMNQFHLSLKHFCDPNYSQKNQDKPTQLSFTTRHTCTFLLLF